MICHQQLIRGWLIIQPSHAWLQPVSVNYPGGRKKVSVSVWSVTISPPRLRVNNTAPRCPPSSSPSLSHLTPGVPGVHWEQWDEMVAPYSSCVRAPSSRTRLSHASSVTRVMRGTRPGDAAPRNFYREKPGVVRDGGGRTVHFCSCPHGDGLS